MSSKAEEVESLLRDVLHIDAQSDSDFIRPKHPLRIGFGDDTEVVPVGEVENRLIAFHAQQTLLDDAEASAKDMIDRFQSDNTKYLYSGSCNRFFDWAKVQPDAAAIVNLEADSHVQKIDRIIFPISDAVWKRYMTKLTYKGDVASDSSIKSFNSVGTSLAALVSLHVKKRVVLTATVRANISEYKKGLNCRIEA